MKYRIEFDGGTSCNVPRLGFGNGYGSYKINDEPVHRCNFNRPMSANAAEIETLAYAVKAIADRAPIDPTNQRVALHVVGDSRIALNWAKKAFLGDLKMSKKVTPEFREAIFKLDDALRPFMEVATTWQPRLKSVATFGH